MNHIGVRKEKAEYKEGKKRARITRRKRRRSVEVADEREEGARGQPGQTGVVPTSALTKCDTTGCHIRSYSTDNKLMFTRRIWVVLAPLRTIERACRPCLRRDSASGRTLPRQYRRLQCKLHENTIRRASESRRSPNERYSISSLL